MARKEQTFQRDGKAYPILYNGRRVLILDSSSDEKFGFGHQLVLWDKSMGFEMGWGDKNEDGTYKAYTCYGPHELWASGSDLKELAKNLLGQHMWSMEH